MWSFSWIKLFFVVQSTVRREQDQCRGALYTKVNDEAWTFEI